MKSKHPRDTYVTVYGRKPVLELLTSTQEISIDKILLAKKAKGDFVKQVIQLCQQKGIELRRVSPEEVSRISKHPKQDQGIVADVIAPGMQHAQDYFQGQNQPTRYWLALDGITTPANIGLIIRSATALGLGVILPLKGSSKINPLVVKASAGTVFRSKILKCERLTPALKAAKMAGYKIYGLAGEEGKVIYTQDLKSDAIFVMGNETEGVGEHLRSLIDGWLTIPMHAGVESLNVACAATIVAAEIARRQLD